MVAEKSVKLLTGVLITHMNERLLNQGHSYHASGLQYGQCFPPGFGHGIFSSFWQKLQFRSQHWGSLKSWISIACLYLKAPLLISYTCRHVLWFPYASSICISVFLFHCQLLTLFMEENKQNFFKEPLKVLRGEGTRRFYVILCSGWLVFNKNWICTVKWDSEHVLLCT